jgi:hypothetical protein
MEIKKFEVFDPGIRLTTSHGWVNVKIDKNLKLRLRRYVEVLDRYLISSGRFVESDKEDLFKKIDALSNYDLIMKNASVQEKLSLVTILQYFKEIRENFNASTSGFLIENLIEALIHGHALSDMSKTDVLVRKKEVETKGIKGIKYQIKLYEEMSDCEVSFPPEIKERCDYYVIAYKSTDGVEFSILDGKNEKDESYILNFARPIVRVPKEQPELKGRIVRFKDNRTKTGPYLVIDPKIINNKFKFKRKIYFQKIDEVIKSCGDDIQSTITNLYNNISELEYLCETIITGFNPELQQMTVDKAKERADVVIDSLKNNVDDLSNEFNF